MLLQPDFLFQVANQLALLGWLLLVLAPRWRVTQLAVLSGAWSLLLAGAYVLLIAAHYFGSGAEGGFSSLAAVTTLFRDPWALLAGWVHYLSFDLLVGAWAVRDAQQRRLPHVLLVPALLLTFWFGPAGLLCYCLLRRRYPTPAEPSPVQP